MSNTKRRTEYYGPNEQKARKKRIVDTNKVITKYFEKQSALTGTINICIQVSEFGTNLICPDKLLSDEIEKEKISVRRLGILAEQHLKRFPANIQHPDNPRNKDYDVREHVPVAFLQEKCKEEFVTGNLEIPSLYELGEVLKNNFKSTKLIAEKVTNIYFEIDSVLSRTKKEIITFVKYSLITSTSDLIEDYLLKIDSKVSSNIKKAVKVWHLSHVITDDEDSKVILQ